MGARKTVFMIMPFGERFFSVYRDLKEKFAADYVFTNAGDNENQHNILRDIVERICRADIVIADLTGPNANVMYELGVAHTLNKKTIMITQDSLSDLPFDLKQYRAKDYSEHFESYNELVRYLRKSLQGAFDGSVFYSNPVTDFMKLSGLENVGPCAGKDK